mgnify:CR=1 FL=1
MNSVGDRYRRSRKADPRSVIKRVEMDDAMIGIANDAAFKQMMAEKQALQKAERLTRSAIADFKRMVRRSE